MRVVELSGHHDDDHKSGTGPASAGPMAFGPTGFGPAAEPDEHHFASRLRDSLGARRAMEQAHLEDLRGSGAQSLKTARNAGHKHALTMLSLGDEWIMYRGYSNAGGDIPQLLLGPHGFGAHQPDERVLRRHAFEVLPRALAALVQSSWQNTF